MGDELVAVAPPVVLAGFPVIEVGVVGPFGCACFFVESGALGFGGVESQFVDAVVFCGFVG